MTRHRIVRQWCLGGRGRTSSPRPGGASGVLDAPRAHFFLLAPATRPADEARSAMRRPRTPQHPRGRACALSSATQLEILTHWDLNPRLSAREADVTPLRHVPSARLCRQSGHWEQAERRKSARYEFCAHSAFYPACVGPTQAGAFQYLARHTRGGTRTRNLLHRREAPYPLGHTSC